MKRDKKHVIDHITRLREIIKRKYKHFKQGYADTEAQLENQYKPLLKELKETRPIKTEPKYENIKFEPFAFSSPNKTLKFDHDESQASVIGAADVSSVLSTADGLETASRFVDEHFTHPLTKDYMLKLMKDLGGTNRTIDHTFGPRYENDTLMVGDKPLKFDDDGSIVIGDTRYKPTEGLYEVLFKRVPDDELYNESDLNAYKNILLNSNGHKKNYQFKNHVNRDRTLKYKHIINKLFPKSLYEGKGITTKVLTKEVPVYWDDPNELCERLRLLIASTEAGNTGHKNEMLSIVEELKEAGIIKGRGNSKFVALLL